VVAVVTVVTVVTALFSVVLCRVVGLWFHCNNYVRHSKISHGSIGATDCLHI
jgi:hypothetical protein